MIWVHQGLLTLCKNNYVKEYIYFLIGDMTGVLNAEPLGYICEPFSAVEKNIVVIHLKTFKQ